MANALQTSFLERVPVPSLASYAAFSGVLAGSVGWQAWQAVRSGGESSGWRAEMERRLSNETLARLEWEEPSLQTRLLFQALSDHMGIIVLINSLWCLGALFGAALIRVALGPLRESEELSLRERLWTFIFYKIVFLFGVVSVEYADEAVGWCAWLTVVGLLFLLWTVVQDRLKYVREGGGTGGGIGGATRSGGVWGGAVVSVGGLAASMGLLAVSVEMWGRVGLNYAAFLGADAVLLGLRYGQCCLRQTLELRRWKEDAEGDAERRASLLYHSQLYFRLAVLATDALHHLHMLLWSGFCLSMACLAVGLQLRHLWLEMERELRRHRNYIRILLHIQDSYPPLELEGGDGDVCPICWERLSRGRRLPCAHVFHQWCLRSWLEQDSSCPSCRQALPLPAQRPPPPQPHPTPQLRLAFHGPRYARWLPSLSLELSSHAFRAPPPPTHSQLNTMATQVLDMFPQLSRQHVLADLAVTNSLDQTIENVLESRVGLGHLAPDHHPHPAWQHHDSDDDDDDDDNEASDDDEDDDAWETEEEPTHLPTPSSSSSPDLHQPYVSPSFSPYLRLQRSQLVQLHRRRYLEVRGVSEADLQEAQTSSK